MRAVCIAFAVCIGLASALPPPAVKVEKKKEVHVYEAPSVKHVAHYPKPAFYGVQFIFHGDFPGKVSIIFC